MPEGQVRLVVSLIVDIRKFCLWTQEKTAVSALSGVHLFYEIVTRIIEKEGGVVCNKMGDGILCLFGLEKLPNHQASVEKAVKAALLIQSVIMNKKEFDYMVGVGISKGYVAHGKSVYIGNAINLSSRLASFAEGGEILICESCKLTNSLSYEVVNMPRLNIKGFKDGLNIYKLIAKTRCAENQIEDLDMVGYAN